MLFHKNNYYFTMQIPMINTRDINISIKGNNNKDDSKTNTYSINNHDLFIIFSRYSVVYSTLGKNTLVMLKSAFSKP